MSLWLRFHLLLNFFLFILNRRQNLVETLLLGLCKRVVEFVHIILQVHFGINLIEHISDRLQVRTIELLILLWDECPRIIDI